MNTVLVGFKRSPFTIANKGLLSKIRPEDILSQVINDLIKTTNINKDDIEDIIAGCAYPEGGGYNKDFNKLVELHSMLHKSCAEII